MMTEKFGGFGASMGPGDGDGVKDSVEDQALWQLLGVLDDVEPSSGFAERLKRGLKAEPIAVRPWYRRGWIPAAAAVLMIAIAIPFALDGNKGKEVSPTIDDVAEYQGVMDLLDGLSDADVLVLEANEAETVQTDWFGG